MQCLGMHLYHRSRHERIKAPPSKRCCTLVHLICSMVCADWIEHVIVTDGDQYLKTPEHLLPWHVRAMLDIYLALALLFGGLSWLAATGMRRLVFGRRRKATITEEKGPAGASKSASGPRAFHVVASAGQGGFCCVLSQQIGASIRACRFISGKVKQQDALRQHACPGLRSLT